MAEDTSIRRLMDQVSEELIRPFREPIRSIYIDADFLYDYRLGALLLSVRSSAEYEYVLSHINDYENGCSKQITKYFPALAVSETDLDNMMSNTSTIPLIHLAAPMTGFLADIYDFIIKINTFNRIKDIDAPLKVIINSRFDHMPSTIWKDLASYLLERCGNIKLELTNYKSWYDVPESAMAEWSMIFPYDLIEFLKVGTTSQKMLADRKCVDKVVVTYPQIDKEFEDPIKETTALNNLANIMLLMVSYFSFLSKRIPFER